MNAHAIRALLTLVALMIASAECRGVDSPFICPLSARVTETSKDGKGWQAQGIANVSFVAAEGQFKSALAQSGWRFQHRVQLTKMNTRALYNWSRGGRTVTLMLWRIDVGKTGFSWGVSEMSKSNAKEK